MRPSELKNQALVAAAVAEREGFTATAEAFKPLAAACATEARDLLLSASSTLTSSANCSSRERFRLFEAFH
jgi:hypothetical protein